MTTLSDVKRDIANNLLADYDDVQDEKLEIGHDGEVIANDIADDVIEDLKANATDLGAIVDEEDLRDRIADIFANGGAKAAHVDDDGLLDRAEIIDTLNKVITTDNFIRFETDTSYQNAFPNCGFLAGMMAVGNTDEGQKAITEAIKGVGGGNYEVEFPAAPNEVFKVSSDDLESAEYEDLSVGNTEMKVFEIAALKFSDKHPDLFGDTIAGKHPNSVAKLFEMDTEVIFAPTAERTSKEILIDYAKKNEGEDISLTFSATADGSLPEVGEDGKPNHFWTITDINVDDNTVTFVNPWNSGDPETVSLDKFEDYGIYDILAF